MGAQILFLEKNYADLQNELVVATASQGNDFTNLARNRKNNSSWMTTGSVDADNTTYELDFIDEVQVDQIILLKHNFKAYTVKYWDGVSAFVDFATPIVETVNTEKRTHYNPVEVATSKIQLRVTGTMVSDADKTLAQFIVTKRLGRFNGYPEIKKPTPSRNRKVTQMLSGKDFVVENVGKYSTELNFKILSDNDDLTLIETLYSRFTGFLFWPGGGDESQFTNIREGYRLEDIFLSKFTNEYQPEYFKFIYINGLPMKMKLSEVTA